MSDPYIGEIKVISFNFAPKGWAFCNGQTLPINQNQALFSILGTQYGGNGTTTFCLPNLQARMPIHQGQGFQPGNVGGEESHTLTIGEMPAHNHLAMAAAAATGLSPNNTAWAPSGQPMFAPTANTTMNAAAIANAGGSLPHENRAPFLVLNFVIALQGIFPSRS
ncbi:MAG TPA: tail fiber protein [Jatrophihabitans sp.]|nr:tail fiber protein [Jatrophihabitans sp.]